MRISDWSSDVCSSDLREEGAHDAVQVHEALGVGLVRVVGGAEHAPRRGLRLGHVGGGDQVQQRPQRLPFSYPTLSNYSNRRLTPIPAYPSRVMGTSGAKSKTTNPRTSLLQRRTFTP